MAKMSKAQTRKRLIEASEKVFKAFSAVYWSDRDYQELLKLRSQLIKFANKLK